MVTVEHFSIKHLFDIVTEVELYTYLADYRRYIEKEQLEAGWRATAAKRLLILRAVGNNLHKDAVDTACLHLAIVVEKKEAEGLQQVITQLWDSAKKKQKVMVIY
jgi:hypothetical protein